MIFDDLMLPKVSGASDRQDSAMLAGTMTCFGWPQEVDCSKYLIFPEDIYVRHPEERKYNFSRDQLIPLIAGLHTQNRDYYVHTSYMDGHDILSPSDYGHINRCQSLKASWIQDSWFWAELYFSAKYKPMDELNQLFCKLWIADDKFIKWYCNANKVWRESLRAYWCEGSGSWRNERELCEWIITKIEGRLD